MRRTRLIMGMPVTVEIIGNEDTSSAVELTFQYFKRIDERFSTYKETSEISKLNRGEILLADAGTEMKEVFRLAEATKQATNGFFDIGPIGRCDPSGIVKGWAINKAALELRRHGYQNFYIDAGGDIAVAGRNNYDEKWRIGIRNPFNLDQIVKVVRLTNGGIATSGTYERGEHIYNPRDGWRPANTLVSTTVIGPSVYEADRFATAAFVMGERGLALIESRAGLEGYAIDRNGRAVMTSGFESYVLSPSAANK